MTESSPYTLTHLWCSYINPFVKFINDNKSWSCNMCGVSNDVPGWYNGVMRFYGGPPAPELACGSVDFNVSQVKGYTTRPLQRPNYVFVLDCTARAMSSGSFAYTLDSITRIIASGSLGPRVEVGFITYTEYEIHFFDEDDKLFLVGDDREPFCPLPPSQFMSNVSQDQNNVLERIKFLKKVRDRGDTRVVGCVEHLNRMFGYSDLGSFI